MDDLPAPFAATPAKPEDLAAVVDAVIASRIADLGQADIGIEAMSASWTMLDLLTETVIVRNEDGQIAAYADLLNRSNTDISIYGDVHPEWRGKGLGRWLVGWGERFALDHMGAADPRQRVSVRHYIVETNAPALQLLENQGYRHVRTIQVMTIDLPFSPIALPPLPQGLSLSPFERGRDERAAFDAMEDAFRDIWGRPPGSFDRFLKLIDSPDADPALMLLAWEGAELAGQVWGTVADGEGWVDAVGVRRPWRKRGLASALLQRLFAIYAERGVTTVKLSVDSESSSRASRVYESAGMTVEQTYRMMEKEIRAGLDRSGNS